VLYLNKTRGVDNKLKTLIELVKRLPEGKPDGAIERIQEIKQMSDEEDKHTVPKCPHRGSAGVLGNGHKNRGRQYRCRACGRSFHETTNSVVRHSHSGEAVWNRVIRDTVNGVPIDETADSLDLHHETVFNMRNKIPCCPEQNITDNPIKTSGVCGADETYPPESARGRRVPPGYRRTAEKHGTVASKRGISDEYICVCAGVEREGGAFSVAVNRASPGKDDIVRVFGGKVSSDTLIV
jgi:transposase-like protein